MMVTEQLLKQCIMECCVPLEAPTIGIWCLFDDGGLAILMRYQPTKHMEFRNHHLRFMALDADSTEMV